MAPIGSHMSESLTPPIVKDALQTVWLGRNYFYYPETDSTNDLLKQRLDGGDSDAPPAGTVILTDYQKKGRGRMERRWEAPAASSLLFSLLLRPSWPASRLTWLTMIAGLAVTEAVEEITGLAAYIKWPNDGVLDYDGAWRKFCGILLDGRISQIDGLEASVIGIGVNVNIPPEQIPAASFPATSLMVAANKRISRLDLLAAIFARLEYHYERAEGGYSPHFAWQERLVFLGRRVVVSSFGHDIRIIGTAVGADEQGRLIIEDDQHVVHHIAAGDVTLREYFSI
jgi:BirA family transcriptional regulator, biotin operon repressor / biotin---[acetyl-CoA-carboxylase] ligase